MAVDRVLPDLDAEADPGPIFELATAFSGSHALFSAVELGVFSELADGPLTLAQLRERLGLHERGARDFLDALVALGMLGRADGRYANTISTARFLDRARPAYIGDALDDFKANFLPLWGSLTDALRRGRPPGENGDGGGTIFSELYADEERMREFLRGMTSFSHPDTRAIAQRFPFERYGTFVDVGCAEGGLAVEVARAHPHIIGGGFDLPVVRSAFERYVASCGLGDRLTFHPGDFLQRPLPSADVLAMGHVLDWWDRDTKQMLIEKAHAALPEGGALIVFESLIDDERRSHVYGLLASLVLLMMTPGGFVCTGADYRQWMRDVGFREIRVEPLPGPDSMVIAVK